MASMLRMQCAARLLNTGQKATGGPRRSTLRHCQPGKMSLQRHSAAGFIMRTVEMGPATHMVNMPQRIPGGLTSNTMRQCRLARMVSGGKRIQSHKCAGRMVIMLERSRAARMLILLQTTPGGPSRSKPRKTTAVARLVLVLWSLPLLKQRGSERSL